MSSRPDPWSEPAHRSAVRSEVLPLDFVAFFKQHHPAYLRYAHLQLDSRDEAQDVVEEVFAILADTWPRVLRQPNVQAYALATLKEVLAERLAAKGRQIPFVATAAFAAVREATRYRLQLLESHLGLYGAIARLPERNYDVIVLRFVLGYPMKTVAHIMGVSYGTVRSHIRGARRRLARDLGIEWAPNEEE
ncbi:sigma-70 family RNA polymerase sigma factor [Streptomyces rimosus]|uniref:RNA polymerase sigma factor n=1 Tax=Streptomyces rimosus TaxID=1927 RepID=UPI0005183A49|nr:sigma-70 family RNA polymerase sigma factor [Streptomyces rimosus]